MSIRKLVSLIIAALISITLTACDGGSSSSSTQTPTDPTLVFSLFPAQFFLGSYSASYSLSGSYSNGDTVTGIWQIQSGTTTTFNSQPVVTINQNLSLTNTASGATTSTIGETYYSPDTNNLTLVGSYRTIDGVSSMATSTSIIPLTGNVGDFGNVGSYTLSDGTNSSITWSLVDGYNGKAKLVTTTVVRDTSNALFATEVDSWTIAQDGTRESVQVTVTYHQSGNLTLTMSGNKS